jgi:hypothetical protein
VHDAASQRRAREHVVIDLLYGHHQGGQRVVSLFTLLPRGDGAGLATVHMGKTASSR